MKDFLNVILSSALQNEGSPPADAWSISDWRAGRFFTSFRMTSLKGFTLVELMIAIAIVGVLASATVVALNPLEQFAKGRDAQRKNDLLQIRNALELYYNDNEHYPLETNDRIEGLEWGQSWGTYMTKLPIDPSGVNYKYETDGAGTYFRLYAKLERCSDAQTIPGTCGTTSHNYAVTSTNAIAVALPTFTPTPTPTPLPKRVFVTSTTYNGDLRTAANALSGDPVSTGLDGGDKICQYRAANATPPRSGTWKAWLSDASKWPADGTRFNQAEVPYKLFNDTVIANSWSELVDPFPNPIDAPIDRDENNNQVPLDTRVHTGTTAQGQPSPNHCNGWTWSNSGTYGSTMGNTDFKTSAWSWHSSTNNNNCYSPFRLYCFEQ